MDIYLDASRLGIYPPLFTSPSANSCILLLLLLLLLLLFTIGKMTVLTMILFVHVFWNEKCINFIAECFPILFHLLLGTILTLILEVMMTDPMPIKSDIKQIVKGLISTIKKN